MTFFKIVFIVLVSCIAVLEIRKEHPELAILISVATTVIVSYQIIGYFATIMQTFSKIIRQSGIDSSIYLTLIKMIGIGYISELAESSCRDFGNSNMAQKIALAGKLAVLIMSLPVFTLLFDELNQLL